MHREPLVAGAVVARCAERIAAREHALFGPPECDLVPADAHEPKRRDGCIRQDVVPHS